MHHLRSFSDVRYFRIAAFLLFLNCLLAPFAAGLLVQSMWLENLQMTVAGSGIVVLSFVLIIPLRLQGYHTNCPLCWTPVLAPGGCAKHRGAKKLMGSHRLPVALAVLFRNRFCCPYCNESTALELHHTARHLADHNTQLD